MTYRELLEITKKNPGCLMSKEQQNKHSELKFRNWLEKQEKEKNTDEEGKEKKYW